jgi:nitrite reductase/ring-hydroxylating ferredoxin subunit/Fe-S cluster biogenesis protein NfuA
MTTIEAPNEQAFENHARRVDDAIAAAHALEPAARAVALELKGAIEAFHRDALVTVVRALRADPQGKELLFELVDDPGLHAVLALHGIVRPSVHTRAAAALATVRPYLQSHGGDVELVTIETGTAKVRLHGACNGCSMSAVTLREGVEEALVGRVEGITAIEVLEDEPTMAFIPLGSVGRHDTGWVAGPEADEVPPGGLLRVDIDDESFIVTNIDNRLAVFRNECAHQGLSLDGGHVDDGLLVCPWHGFRYDATSGECLSAPGAQLQQVPLRLDEGRIFIRAR